MFLRCALQSPLLPDALYQRSHMALDVPAGWLDSRERFLIEPEVVVTALAHYVVDGR